MMDGGPATSARPKTKKRKQIKINPRNNRKLCYCLYGLVSGKVKRACGSYTSTGENWGTDNQANGTFQSISRRLGV